MADPFAGALDTIYAHSGVDVTIPFPPFGAAPLSVRALRQDFDPAEVPFGTEITELRTGEDRAVYCFRRSSVAELPKGTVLEAPEVAGGPVLTWKVESLLRKSPLELTVLVRVVR
jgi:hypothetical protein